MFKIMKRRQAADEGQRRYFTGVACSKGHTAQRYTSTGVCVTCAAGYVKEYNGRMRREANSRAAGLFTYELHPEDGAAALAFCQALDLQRGRIPKAPPSVVIKSREPFDAAAARRAAFGKALSVEPAPYLPKP